MKITVITLFRDSEKKLNAYFKRLEAFERRYEMEYYFYENDSKDNTRKIITEWMKKRKGRFIYEDLNTPSFGHITNKERMELLTQYRNTILNKAKPLTSDYTLLLDSDIDYKSDIIKKYLKRIKDDIVMCTPFIKQNIKCYMCNCGQPSYYDCFALKDKDNNNGLLTACNPFLTEKDRQQWDRKEPVEVNAAFGGIALIKTAVLNEVEWATTGGCEHWLFCEAVRKYGKILVIPTIEAFTEVKEWAPQPQQMALQHQLIDDPWARMIANL